MRDCLSILAFVLVACVARICNAAEPAYVVVVHPSNPVAAISRAKLADLFLRKVGSWDSGAPCKPVDQPDESAARRAFSEEVLRRSVSAVSAYWQQRVFSGRGAPPPLMSTDEEVAAFVRSNPNAVGYLSPKSELRGLKVLQVVP